MVVSERKFRNQPSKSVRCLAEKYDSLQVSSSTCYSTLLHQTYGDANPLTLIECAAINPGRPLVVSVYEEKPPRTSECSIKDLSIISRIFPHHF